MTSSTVDDRWAMLFIESELIRDYDSDVASVIGEFVVGWGQGRKGEEWAEHQGEKEKNETLKTRIKIICSKTPARCQSTQVGNMV